MTPLYVTTSDRTTAGILRAVGSTARKATLYPATRVTLSGTYWDGGQRNSYTAVRLADFARVDLPRYDPPQYGGPVVDPTIEVPEGIAIVCSQVGYRPYVTIYVNPASLARLLPAGSSDLPEDTAIVLCATAALKNSYGGRTDIRFTESARATGITRERWDLARADAIRRRFLNAAGSITADGRNAVAGHPMRSRIR